MRFFRRSGGNDGVDDPKHRADLAVLAQLQKAGVDLAKPRLLEHFIYVETESTARRVAGELSALGYAADVNPSPTGSDWSVVAAHIVAPTPSEIRRVRAELTTITDAARGEYDGWGTPIDR